MENGWRCLGRGGVLLKCEFNHGPSALLLLFMFSSFEGVWRCVNSWGDAYIWCWGADPYFSFFERWKVEKGVLA